MKALRLPTRVSTVAYLVRFRSPRDSSSRSCLALALLEARQENERGALAEIIGECVNRGINIKVTVLGPDAEPTVELPWDNKLEDYRTEIGRFMEVVYLPITLKVNDDEPQIVNRLHEEPYRNVLRLVTLLSEPTTGSDPRQSMRETKTVSVQLDNLLSTEEKAALTSYYPDKRLKISEARRIMVQFDTSKGTMLIKIMMGAVAICVGIG